MKQKLNETKTEATLTLQYKESNAEGLLQTTKRLHDKQHSVLEKKIARLNKEIETEDLVSRRIRDWHNRKVEELDEEQADRDKLKNDRVENIKKEVQVIMEQKQEDEEEIARMDEEIKEEQKMQELKEAEEAQKKKELEAK